MVLEGVRISHYSEKSTPHPQLGVVCRNTYQLGKAGSGMAIARARDMGHPESEWVPSSALGHRHPASLAELVFHARFLQ